MMSLSGIPTTNANGVTTLDNLAPGRYEVSVARRQAATVQVVVHSGGDSPAALVVTD